MNIDQIKTANAYAGFHFFEPATLRFFSSRVHSNVYGGRYFVTSEKRTGFYSADGPRLFTVRRFNDDGSIDTIGGFQRFETRAQAHGFARRCAEHGEPSED